MIKLRLFGYKITIEKEGEKQKKAVKAKVNATMEKIEQGLKTLQEKNIKYSEYKLQKITGLSINTIKKYRSYIAKLQNNV